MPKTRSVLGSIEGRSPLRWITLAAFVLLSIASPSIGPMAASSVTVGGPFVLGTPDGRTVTDQTFRHKWLLIYFGYTSCPDSCPTALLQIAKALTALGPDADKVEPLFITLDPEHDTPRVMGEYTRSFDSRILGLSGTPEQIAAVVSAYGVYVQRRDVGSGSSISLIDHSTYIYLMDPSGTFVRGFDHDAPADKLAAALRTDMTRDRTAK